MKKFLLAFLLVLVCPIVNVHADGEFKNKPFTATWGYPEQFQQRIDYGARTDGQPVYLGQSVMGTATSVDNWVIYKFTYDGSDHATLRQVATGTWDNRASLTYS